MTTFIKTKFKKSDDQTIIDKYRAAANIKEYHNILKLIFLRIIIRQSLYCHEEGSLCHHSKGKKVTKKVI